MSVPFKGKVNVDIRDSVPDWSPFVPPKAPEGAPSVVYVVLDDVAVSAMGCYGSPIETPNIDRIAASGVRYTQWHTTAAPVREGRRGRRRRHVSEGDRRRRRDRARPRRLAKASTRDEFRRQKSQSP
jgi:hypothetical protein